MGTLRTLARGMAKKNMKNHGYVKFCKHGYYGREWEKTRTNSIFAEKWRKEIKK